MPSTAASTSTLGSNSRAASIASSSSAWLPARVMPMLEPPRAGLTNSGQPSSPISSSTRLRSFTACGAGRAEPADSAGAADCAGSAGRPRQSRSRTTTYRPTGSPRAAKISFMYSLSMPAALASTPAPA